MYNSHDPIYTFYNDYVRLNTEKQRELTEYRDRNLNRLREGLGMCQGL